MTVSRTVRIGLAALGLSAAAVGIPALLAPRTFFSDFPFVAHWVDRLGPYNQHLTTDVGTLYLVVATLFGWAAITGARALAVPLCAAWAAAGAIHTTFHAAHLASFPTADAIAQTASLSIVAITSLLVLWLMRRDARPAVAAPRRASPRPHAGPPSR